jgi:hypothetical protein
MRMKIVIWYVVSVVLAMVLMGVFVLGPSNRERREHCDSVGGVIISSGDCVKRDSVLL